MPSHRKATLALLLVLLVAWPATVLAGDITIATSPGAGEAGSLRFTMPSADSSASFVLYVRNDGSADQQGLDLLAFLEDANRQPMPGVGVDFLDGNGQPLGSFDLKANSQRRIELQVDELADHGVFTGTIVLQQTPVVTESLTSPATQEILTQFTLDHPGQAKIRVLEADDQDNIVLATSGREFTFPLTLIEEQGQVDVADLVVKVGGLTRQDGGRGEPATLTWSSEGETAGPLALQSKGYRALTLTGVLPEATAYQGWLSLGYGGQVEPYVLKISRSDAGRLSVLEAGDDGAVALNVRGSDSNPVLTLQVADGQPAVDDLTVALGELRRQDGQVLKDETLACSLCDGSEHQLAPGVALPLTLSPAGLQPTTYLATLFLSYEGRSHAVPLTVTRAALLNNLQVDKPDTVSSVNWWLTPTVAQVPVSVEETAGLDTTIYYPSAGDLQLTDPDQRVWSFSPDQVQILLQEPSGRLVPVPTPSADDANPTLTLPANDNLDFVYRLEGLGAVGAYSGKVRVLGPDNSRVTQDFTVNVKHGFLYAFLAIFGGVWLSYYWHNWRKEGRSRALLGRDIAETREEIEAIPDRPPDDPVWKSLLARLEKLERQNRDKTLELAAAQNTLKDLQNRQKHTMEAGGAYKVLMSLLDTFPKEPPDVAKLADTYRQQGQAAFQAVQAALAGESGGLGDGPTDAPANIKVLRELYDTARRKAIEAPAQAMATDLEALIAEAGSAPWLQGQARSLKDRLDRIQQAVATPGDYAALAEDLKQVRRDYIELRLEELQARVESLQAGQAAAPDASWNTVNQLLAQVTEEAEASRASLAAGDADAALQAWQEADNTLLGATIEQLVVLASPQGHPDGMPADQWQKLLDGAADLKPNLQDAQAKWTAGKYDDAAAAYDKAQQAFLGVQSQVLLQRIDAFFEDRMTRPEFVDAILWQKHVPESDLKQALASLKSDLAKASGDPAKLSQAYQDGRARSLKIQIDWMEGARAALEAVYEQANGQVFELTKDPWTKDIPKGLDAMDQAVQQAGDNLRTYQASNGQDVGMLGQAEASGHKAEKLYQQLLNAFAAAIRAVPKPKDDIKGVAEATYLEVMRRRVRQVAATETLGLMAEAPAASPRVGAAVAFQPEPSQLSAVPQVQAMEPRTSEEWDRYIRTNDRRVLWISLFLAAASGLSVLYLSNATFGTLGHYLSAFLWGFGIQAGTELVAAGAPGVPKAGPALGLDTQ